MSQIQGTPNKALWSATLGFFVGFAAVALFGPTAARFQQAMGLSPMAVGLLVAVPALSGSLLRIPFAAWVDTTGGRRPFLVLLLLSVLGMVGFTLVVYRRYPDGLTPGLYPVLLLLGVLCGCGIATFTVGISQVAYWFPRRQQGRALAIFAGVGNLAPGMFSILLPLALAAFGLAGSYLIWLVLLVAGTLLYAVLGKNAWYFQLLDQGLAAEAARAEARLRGQELFPAVSVAHSLRASARVWRTWALVWIYFATFGGFIALTAWLPTYWVGFYGMSPIKAGLLTALYSLLASVVRIGGGILSDTLREGGENTAILSLLVMLVGSIELTGAQQYELALPGVILMAVGMGMCNAAVFKLVPQEVPQAVGGAAGWVGGLGAFGGFVIPPTMAFAVQDLGTRGYAIGFVTFTFLALSSLGMIWVLKYTPKAAEPRLSLAVAAGKDTGRD